MSDYNFIRFVNRGAKVGNYAISVNGSYSFGLLSGFYLKENIGKYKRAVLFFDKGKKAIAFSFTNDENSEGSFAITHGSSNRNGSISARSFFMENDLKQDEFLGQRIVKKEKDNRLGTLYVIDLIEKN